MPYINIQIAKGHSEDKKTRIARRIAQIVMDETGLSEDAVWIVFQDIPSEQWFVGKASVKELDDAASK
jgi:4-oxalocrotonate tautomerase